MEKGIVFDIQRFSLHDGPGLRTIVFLKGCPLRCTWCSNPESHNPTPEIMYFSELCIGCHRCMDVCPMDCISPATHNALTNPQGIQVDYNKCIACGSCEVVCPTGALSLVGKPTTVETLIELLEKDQTFYNLSEGGITLSGGELFVQKAFAIALIKACKSKGWHITIETTGFYLDQDIIEALSYVDLILFDLKVMDETLHRKYTGQELPIILKHFSSYVKYGNKVIVRVPIIPNINDTSSNTGQLLRFLKSYKAQINEIHLLPYHEYGKNKYDSLGLNYSESLHLKQNGFSHTTLSLSPQKIQSIIQSEGYICKIGG